MKTHLLIIGLFFTVLLSSCLNSKELSKDSEIIMQDPCIKLVTEHNKKQFYEWKRLHSEYFDRDEYEDAFTYLNKAISLSIVQDYWLTRHGREKLIYLLESGHTEFFEDLLRLSHQQLKCADELEKWPEMESNYYKNYFPHDYLYKKLTELEENYENIGAETGPGDMMNLFEIRIKQYRLNLIQKTELADFIKSVNLSSLKARNVATDTLTKVRYQKIIDKSSLSVKQLTEPRHPMRHIKPKPRGIDAINSCSDVYLYFIDGIISNPNDTNLLIKYNSILENRNCESTGSRSLLNINHMAMRRELTYKINSIKPTTTSLLNGAAYYRDAENWNMAVVSYLKALKLESDSIKKANIYVELAIVYQKASDYEKAFKILEKALVIKAEDSKIYGLMARQILSSRYECGKTELEKAGLLWLATDYMALAIKNSKNPSTINVNLEALQGQFPNEEQLLLMGLSEGSSHRVGCWINKSTTVRGK